MPSSWPVPYAVTCWRLRASAAWRAGLGEGLREPGQAERRQQQPEVAQDWQSFLSAFGPAYQSLDAQLEGLAAAERSVFEGSS
jgi:hypothetical protein